MNKKLILGAVLAATTLGLATTAVAKPAYMGPAGAWGCADCHVNGTRSETFVPGILEAFPIDQKLPTIRAKIKAIFALTDAQRLPALKAINKTLNPPATAPDTAPVIKIEKSDYNVTVGEAPLNIAVTVFDAEKDTFSVDGPALDKTMPTAYSADNTSTFNYTWKDIDPAFAGVTYPVRIGVREDNRKQGRILFAKHLKSAKITVWPARANAAKAKVSQFDVNSAAWIKNMLMVSGKVMFKSSVTDAERTAALKAIKLNVRSKNGVSLYSAPVDVNANGTWTVSLPKSACTVVAEFEGLKAQHSVAGASGSCVK